MSRPRHLKIDFAEREDGASWSGIALLALGVAAMASAIAALQDIQGRAARIEAELGRMKLPARAGGALLPAHARAAGGSLERANAVVRRLARRWDRVFLAIESASDAHVALLAIEPDARKGVVRVTAEARNKDAMLRYVTRLQAAQALERVLLEHHEVRSQDADRPVRFVVSGEWEETP